MALDFDCILLTTILKTKNKQTRVVPQAGCLMRIRCNSLKWPTYHCLCDLQYCRLNVKAAVCIRNPKQLPFLNRVFFLKSNRWRCLILLFFMNPLPMRCPEFDAERLNKGEILCNWPSVLPASHRLSARNSYLPTSILAWNQIRPKWRVNILCKQYKNRSL